MGQKDHFATEWVQKLSEGCMNRSTYQDACDVTGSQFQSDQYFLTFLPIGSCQPEVCKQN